MNDVNKTMYIPLYGKAYVSRKGIILNDKKAEEIWDAQCFELKGKSKSKWLAYYMGMRLAVFDHWLKTQMKKYQDAIIVHIGCGMDSRVERVGTMGHLWYDVDFSDVIRERIKYYHETDAYHMIEADVRDEQCLAEHFQKGCIAYMNMWVVLWVCPNCKVHCGGAVWNLRKVIKDLPFG